MSTPYLPEWAACVDCSVGLFAAASGATACDACAAGTYATDDADDADNAGVAAGAVACAACAAGTYAPKNGAGLCYTCDVDAGQWSAPRRKSKSRLGVRSSSPDAARRRRRLGLPCAGASGSPSTSPPRLP